MGAVVEEEVVLEDEVGTADDHPHEFPRKKIINKQNFFASESA